MKKNSIINILYFLFGSIVTLLIIITIKNNSIDNYELSIINQIKKVNSTVVTLENIDKKRGSGFIYKIDDKYAYIITNEHVVTSSDIITVSLYNEVEIEGTVLGKDKYLDLAVIRTDKKYIKGVAKLGNSDKTNIGERVFTIGTPISNEFKNSVTSGIISGKNRRVDTTAGEEQWIMDLMQIDASINTGNSGGPLFNTKGKVIGVSTLKIVDNNAEAMSFAIPINIVKKYIDKLERKEEIIWPNIGIKVDKDTDFTDDAGATITGIKEGSLAYKAGLKENDIITKINKYEIKRNAYFKYVLYKYNSNDKIKITYIRNGKTETTTIIIK